MVNALLASDCAYSVKDDHGLLREQALDFSTSAAIADSLAALVPLSCSSETLRCLLLDLDSWLAVFLAAAEGLPIGVSLHVNAGSVYRSRRSSRASSLLPFTRADGSQNSDTESGFGSGGRAEFPAVYCSNFLEKLTGNSLKTVIGCEFDCLITAYEGERTILTMDCSAEGDLDNNGRMRTHVFSHSQYVAYLRSRQRLDTIYVATTRHSYVDVESAESSPMSDSDDPFECSRGMSVFGWKPIKQLDAAAKTVFYVRMQMSLDNFASNIDVTEAMRSLSVLLKVLPDSIETSSFFDPLMGLKYI